MMIPYAFALIVIMHMVAIQFFRDHKEEKKRAYEREMECRLHPDCTVLEEINKLYWDKRDWSKND